MPDPSDDDSLTGEVLLERYSVGPRVARGGFAAVYRGRHLELDVPVALKVLAPREGDAASRAAWLALMPTSAVSIAIIVSVRTAYVTVLSGSLETVVIIGALVAEMVFRVSLFVAGGRSMLDAEAAALPIEHETPDAPGAASVPPAQMVPPPGVPPDDTTERPS